MNGRRIRIVQTSKNGWGYTYEICEPDGKWRVVDRRGRGHAWSLDEAITRATTTAGLVGARVLPYRPSRKAAIA